MTLEEAIAEAAVDAPLSHEDLRGFVQAFIEDPATAETLLKTYRLGQAPEKSFWDRFVDKLRECDEAAGIAIPLANMVTAVFAAAVLL